MPLCRGTKRYPSRLIMVGGVRDFRESMAVPSRKSLKSFFNDRLSVFCKSRKYVLDAYEAAVSHCATLANEVRAFLVPLMSIAGEWLKRGKVGFKNDWIVYDIILFQPPLTLEVCLFVSVLLLHRLRCYRLS